MHSGIDACSWNRIVAQQPHAPFLQSYQWGEFQKNNGHAVDRFVFIENGKETTVAHVFLYQIFFGFFYLYLPHGPVGEQGLAEQKAFFEYVRDIQKKTKALFLRIEPRGGSKNDIVCRAQKETISLQPRATLLVSLEKSEDALLAAMHPKTRYNIRVAKKQGIEVRAEDVPTQQTQEKFLLLLKETAHRDRFFLHQDSYYQKLFLSFQEKTSIDPSTPFVRLYTAWAGEEMLAGGIVFFFGDTATYLHGASSSQNRKAMAPYALHWRVLQEAKALGYKVYDFWGIAETDDPSDPWAGLTRFKKGFGGSVVEHPVAIDCIFSPFLYTLYIHTKKLRKIVNYLRRNF